MAKRARTGLTVKNALTVKVIGYLDVDSEVDDNNQIISLDIPELSKIGLGNVIKIGKNKDPYKINTIKAIGPSNNVTYELSIAKRTKASLFILPMLPGNRAKYYFDTRLLNCFIGTHKHKNVIALLYRFSAEQDFIQFEKMLMGLDYYMESEDLSKRTVLYTFKIPDDHLENYTFFIDGKYSEFLEKYKVRILRFHNSGKSSTLGKILYKDPTRKEELEKLLELNIEIDKNAELYSIPNLEEETLNLEVYGV